MRGEDGGHVDIPLVVLVNRQSASAAEIVSGAVQDHDRGLIVGETTFGKALVQSVFRVSRDAGLALTTARYYTPSGRMIQRPWDGTFDEYLTYSLRDQKPSEKDPDERRLTNGGARGVPAAGGIEPDYFLAGPIEGVRPDAVRAPAVRAAGVRHVRRELLGRGRHPHRGPGRGPPAARARVRHRRRHDGCVPRPARGTGA